MKAMIGRAIFWELRNVVERSITFAGDRAGRRQ